MTVRYVGIGGDNGNSGLSWALRKLTVVGVESTVTAGDIVYIGPGRHTGGVALTTSGSDGSPIVYIGDVTGEHTDGVGGRVRLSGLDSNEQTFSQTYILNTNGVNVSYRTFRGIEFDGSTSATINNGYATSTNWIIEDCVFHSGAYSDIAFTAACNNITVRRCIFMGNGQGGSAILFSNATTVSDAVILVENCIFFTARGVRTDRVGGISIKNCRFQCGAQGVRVGTALAASSYVYVYNSIFTNSTTGLQATALGEIVEDYNTFFSNTTDRSTVNTGANSVSYASLPLYPILLDGHIFPVPPIGTLNPLSAVGRKAGTSESTEDLFGMARPSTSSKKSWGAIQVTGAIRETTTVHGGSASVKLPDAGEQFLMRVPITAVSTTIACKCYREADYAGTLPQMILRQPGQSDRTTTDSGSASTWNTLTDTFTPASLPPYVDIFIKSNNTATTGNYDTFFDTVAVS